MREGQTVLMLELADLVLHRVDILETNMFYLHRRPPPLEPSRALPIPRELAALFASIAAGRYNGRATTIPMADGIKEAIFYLDRATSWHERRGETQTPEIRWANLFRASWVLQATKASDEYRATVERATMERFERQFPRLGMSVRRFFGKLEVVSITVGSSWLGIC